MLVEFQDNKGQTVWVNPVHVRMVRVRGKFTEITFGVGHGTWGLWVVKVAEAPERVAQRLNDAAGLSLASLPLDDDGELAAANPATLLG